MKNNNKRKGFTLVELLVVIAILAILATVSVVGYTSFIEKANKSNASTEAAEIEKLIKSVLMVDGEYTLATVYDSSDATKVTEKYVIKEFNNSGYYQVVKVTLDTSGNSSDSEALVNANTVFVGSTTTGKITVNDDLADVLGSKNTLTVASSNESLTSNSSTTTKTVDLLTFIYVGSSSSYTVTIDLNDAIGTNE